MSQQTAPPLHRARLVTGLVVALILAATAGGLFLLNQRDASAGGDLAAPLALALEGATAGAEQDGVTLVVTSGRRSGEHQQQLWDEALERYGTAEEAARWVLPPQESAHVTGEAVDVNAQGADWLVREGWRHGLCQRYANEWWHFELLTEPGTPCPPVQAHAGSDR